MTVPTYLTRYYVAGEDPFLTLDDLPLTEANRIKRKANDRYGWGGFYAEDGYLVHRRSIEEWIVERFREKGGKPVDRAPVYAFLGEPPHSFHKFREETAVLRIPLEAIDERSVSFVWPDSMYEAVIDGSGDFTGTYRRTDTPAVYRYAELPSILPSIERINAVVQEGYPRAGIEAQLWDRGALCRWLGRGLPHSEAAPDSSLPLVE